MVCISVLTSAEVDKWSVLFRTVSQKVHIEETIRYNKYYCRSLYSVIMHYTHYILQFSMDLCVPLSMYCFVHLLLDMWVLIYKCNVNVNLNMFISSKALSEACFYMANGHIKKIVFIELDILN